MGSWNSLFCDRCACEEIQDEAHAHLMCRDADVCALRKKFAYLFSHFSDDFSIKQLSAQAVNDFLLQQTFLFCVWANGFIVDWRGPVTGRSAEQSGWRSPRVNLNRWGSCAWLSDKHARWPSIRQTNKVLGEQLLRIQYKETKCKANDWGRSLIYTRYNRSEQEKREQNKCIFTDLRSSFPLAEVWSHRCSLHPFRGCLDHRSAAACCLTTTTPANG
jgi:hypothetical protein